MELDKTDQSVVTLDDTTVMVAGKRKKVQDIAAHAEIEYIEFKAKALDIIGRMLADTQEKLEAAVKYFEETIKNLNVKKEMKILISDAKKTMNSLCSDKNQESYKRRMMPFMRSLTLKGNAVTPRRGNRS